MDVFAVFWFRVQRSGFKGWAIGSAELQAFNPEPLNLNIILQPLTYASSSAFPRGRL